MLSKSYYMLMALIVMLPLAASGEPETRQQALSELTTVLQQSSNAELSLADVSAMQKSLRNARRVLAASTEENQQLLKQVTALETRLLALAEALKARNRKLLEISAGESSPQSSQEPE